MFLRLRTDETLLTTFQILEGCTLKMRHAQSSWSYIHNVWDRRRKLFPTKMSLGLRGQEPELLLPARLRAWEIFWEPMFPCWPAP